MFWTKKRVSPRKAVLSLTVLSLTAVGLFVGTQFNSTNASTAIAAANSSVASPAAVFPGTGVGAIPDGLSGTPPQYGPPLVVSFNVTGIAGAISNIDVNMTLTHSWVGDVDVVLAAPGGSPSLVVVGHIGVIAAGAFGDSSNYGGTYVFDDSATGPNIWTVATAGTCGDTCTVAAGTYRTTQRGMAGQVNPPPVTSMQTTFGSLTPAQINGTWTLTFRDGASVDIGSVTAANLIIDSAVVVADAPVDFNGDGKTDYSVARNTGGGPSGQITWSTLLNGGGTQGVAWGLATDFFVPEDYDGDLKDDYAVWRPGAATQAAFYILQSNGNTVRAEAFGQTGDDATVVGDYNNDGKSDIAVYRSGAAAGQPSFWYYRTVANGPVTVVGWGQNGDFPAPGDYDGDGKNDFVIQRNAGGGNAAFWRHLTTAPDDTIIFGTPTDVIVPGDYDGDGKTDIATIRGSGGQILWVYDPSGIPGTQTIGAFWGNSATDFATQGDYDGDGKTDLAIWRPNADPTMNFFWVRNSSSSAATVVEWGQSGDFPVANYNTH